MPGFVPVHFPSRRGGETGLDYLGHDELDEPSTGHPVCHHEGLGRGGKDGIAPDVVGVGPEVDLVVVLGHGGEAGGGGYRFARGVLRRRLASVFNSRIEHFGVFFENIDLGHGDLVGLLRGDLIEDRRNAEAGPTPLGPEVDDDRLVGRGDLLGEVGLGEGCDGRSHEGASPLGCTSSTTADSGW